jgi:hypothetical protein
MRGAIFTVYIVFYVNVAVYIYGMFVLQCCIKKSPVYIPLPFQSYLWLRSLGCGSFCFHYALCIKYEFLSAFFIVFIEQFNRSAWHTRCFPLLLTE